MRSEFSFSRTTLERMKPSATASYCWKFPVRSSVTSALHSFSTPRSPHTPSLPGTIPVLTLSGAADAKANSCSNNVLMNLISLIFRIALLLTPLGAMAVPIPRTKPVSLKGEIVDWVWRGAMHYAQEESGWWFEGDEPAHYLLVLDVQNVDREQLKNLTGIVSTMPVRHTIMDKEFKPNQVLLFVPSKRLKEMRHGANLEITNYTLSGDERSTWASFGVFTIDGKKPTSAGPLFPEPPATKKAGRAKSSAPPKRPKKTD